ncbi:MAG: SDR family NAD(P)-dependent oxidoreductase [Burkholderiaceae bacterium]
MWPLPPMNPPLTDWQGKNVWLIGASSGIGQACATALAEAGARVVVSARSREPLQLWCQNHPGSLAVAFDVTDVQATQAAVQQVLAHTPTLDMVVYCSGHYQAQRATALDPDEIQRHMDINYLGAARVLHGVLPHMLKQAHGHISLISSVAAWRGLPRALAYGPSKAALSHMGEVLYQDLRPLGLGVSVVHPGFVQTPLTANNAFHMPGLMQPEQAARRMLQGWAQGRFCIHFPKRLSWVLLLLRLLPVRLALALIRRTTGG